MIPGTTSDPTTVSSTFETNFTNECLIKSGHISSVVMKFVVESTSNESKEILIMRPIIEFDIRNVTEHGVIVHFDQIFDENDYFLLYYPNDFDAFNQTINDDQIKFLLRCQLIHSYNLEIKNLQPSTIYTFCVVHRYLFMNTPFLCKSKQTAMSVQRKSWIVREHKMIILTSFLVNIILVIILISIIMICFLKSRIKMLPLAIGN